MLYSRHYLATFVSTVLFTTIVRTLPLLVEYGRQALNIAYSRPAATRG